MRVFFYVQYLKGIGHLQRARLIAEAAATRGHRIDMVLGGLPVPGFAPAGVETHRLPALQAGPGGFSDLRDADGHVVNDDWRARRRDRLLAFFDDLKPDLVLVESYPFGRRQFAFELEPLLEQALSATPRPAIVSSIRDILQIKTRPGRNAATAERIEQMFDAVLVHGDPQFVRLEETFGETAAIADRVHYTGIVAAPASDFEPDSVTPRDEVLVSMGGGAIGPRLPLAALSARPATSLASCPWRFLTGPHLPDADFEALCAAAPQGVTVERFRSDFRRCLAAARLSVSYAGYNTTTDLLRADVPAVLITYSGDGGETEQAMRARRLAEKECAVVLSDSDLSGDALASAIETALQRERPGAFPIDLEGADRTADLLSEIYDNRML